ncbi:SDR family oxidoreductase [Alcanivorax sp. ZXX171]|nr:SDR family oxidoreductase [Alcanivorax sp. ZXX171]
MTILITGASGFIGRHLCARLTARHTPVLALMRNPEALPALRERINGLGGDGAYLDAVAGDLDAPDLGIATTLPDLTAIIHLGARFAWRLPNDAARLTNVAGSLAVARLARRQACRLVFISGFMLENTRHLRRVGVIGEDPARIDWNRVYRLTGAYEGSKLEAAIAVRHALRDYDDWVEVQPATVAGDSVSGDLDPSQPLYTLIDNLARGRLMRVPGGPDHWLPLIPVDTLASMIHHAAVDASPPPRLLALAADTPNLLPMLTLIAEALERRPPRGYVPMRLLSWLLRVPGVARFANTYPETLHFIQPDRFELSAMEAFTRAAGLTLPPIRQVLGASTRHYLAGGESALPVR